MPPLRYVLAFFSGCLIVAAGTAFCASVRQSFVEDFREELRKEKAAGKLPPELADVDIETITPDGFDIEVSEKQMLKLSLTDFITEFWFIWVIVVFGSCFGIAYLHRWVHVPLRGTAIETQVVNDTSPSPRAATRRIDGNICVNIYLSLNKRRI